MNIFFKLIILVFLNGILAMLSQIVLFREILSQVYANELVLGFMLFAWLISGAFAGTYIYERFIKNLSFKKIFYLIIFLPLLSIIVVIILILFIRVIKAFLGMPAEVLINIWDAVIITLIVFFPVNFILTINFSFLMEFLKKNSLNEHASLFYLFESLGAIFIGIIYTFFLAGNTPNLILIYWIGVINLGIIYIIFYDKRQENNKIQLILTLILIIYLLPLITNFINRIDKKSLDFNFAKQTILFNKELRTAKITITKKNNIYNIYSNGIIQYSKPDEKNKELSGWAVSAGEKIKKILIINGGYTGLIEEFLKFNSIDKIYYIENDNEEAKILKKFFIDDIKSGKEKVEFYYGDAIYFLKNNKINERFDVIALNIGFEGTLFSARYFSKEFLEILKDYLNEKGILFFSLNAGENYIDKKILLKLSSIYKTVKLVFKEIFLIHGDSLYFICGEKKIYITPEKVLNKLEKEKVKIPIFNKRYLEKILDKKRQDNINKLLKESNARINTIFSPVVCFYGVLSDLFYFKNNFNILKITGILFFLSGLFFFIIKPEELKNNFKLYLNMFLISFIGINFQMILIFLFQSIWGYIYQMIGLLFAIFMAGIVVGCFFVYISKKDPVVTFIFILIINLIFLLIIKDINSILILLSLFSAGFFIGSSYAIIVVKTNASFLYGVDLLGGATGAFLISIFFVPVLGIKTTMIFCILFLFILLFLRRKENAQ